MSARVAAIDCGTNSIRLLIADLPEASAGEAAPLRDVTRRMEIVRLGQGVDQTGMLAPEAIERTQVALADYAAEIEKSGVERVRMCATSASRDASNAADFRAMVERTLGVPPEVVTGDEEARLSFTGAVRGLPADAEPPYLVVDIGVASMPLQKVTVPTFILSHRRDGCDVTPASDIPKLVKRLTSARKTESAVLDGGSPPRSEPCEAMSQHGFIGIEQQAVSRIADFVKQNTK